MKPPEDLSPQQLQVWVDRIRLTLADAPDALEWYSLWQKASNLLDDLVDRDVVLSGDNECELAKLMLLLTMHPFYQRHQQVLGVLILTLLAMYRVSLDRDKDRCMSAWLMAEAGRIMPVVVVLLARGYDSAVTVSRFMMELMGQVYNDDSASDVKDFQRQTQL